MKNLKLHKILPVLILGLWTTAVQGQTAMINIQSGNTIGIGEWGQVCLEKKPRLKTDFVDTSGINRKTCNRASTSLAGRFIDLKISGFKCSLALPILDSL